MTVLSVRLFGKFAAQRGDERLESQNTCKIQELLAYLLLYRERPHTRETLASLFWPGSTSEQARKNLRHTLWKLHIVFDSADAGDHDGILLVDTDWICLNPEADLWLDVAEFEHTCIIVRRTSGHELDEQSQQMVRKALKLYRADLLEGWYHDWCLFERERLQSLYLALLEKRMDYCAAHGDYEAGLEWGGCALRCDPAQERIHRRLMRLYYLTGNRTAALRQYVRCANLLREELNVGPSTRTQALYQQICSDTLVDPGMALSQGDGKNSEGVAPALIQTLYHLKQLQGTLAEADCQVQRIAQSVESALNAHK